MSAENLNTLQDDDDGDVVIEGSELHRALVNAGYDNFDLVPRAKEECVSRDAHLPLRHIRKTWKNDFHYIPRYFYQENNLRRKQLSTILNANILLDDHAAKVHEFLNEDEKKGILRKFGEWLPVVGSAGLLAIVLGNKSTKSTAIAGAILSSYVYIKAKNMYLAWKLKRLVKLQSDLHNTIKHSLKIFRRYYKKSIVNELHEKNASIGRDKYIMMTEIKEIVFDIFKNLSYFYVHVGQELTNLLPLSLWWKCQFTDIEFEHDLKGTIITEQNAVTYDELKSSYYTFVLAQSEVMFALANALYGKEQDQYFKIPYEKLEESIDSLYNQIEPTHVKLCDYLQIYKNCKIQPVKRVFRGVPSSKWHDVYTHLDITSHRIQLAYKEISNIFELIDANSEDTNEDSLMKPITEKMNEAYKQLENARSFAEFSSLLIAKAQKKAVAPTDTEHDSENIFPVNEDNRKVVIVDKDIEIEDEVFEEYITEEYLKPLIEGTDSGIIDEYKLDKLLKKNFMSELKDVLVDKQKSMSERELKALKRMYERMKKDSSVNKTDLDKNNDDTSALPPPPPAPPLPPPTLENRIIAETEEPEENIETLRKNRAPVPLPRVKMLQSDDPMPYVQKFSISECTPNFKFPAFSAVEETFLGSGENSEEEVEDEDEDEDENADKTISSSENGEVEH